MMRQEPSCNVDRSHPPLTKSIAQIALGPAATSDRIGQCTITHQLPTIGKNLASSASSSCCCCCCPWSCPGSAPVLPAAAPALPITPPPSPPAAAPLTLSGPPSTRLRWALPAGSAWCCSAGAPGGLLPALLALCLERRPPPLPVLALVRTRSNNWNLVGSRRGSCTAAGAAVVVPGGSAPTHSSSPPASSSPPPGRGRLLRICLYTTWAPAEPASGAGCCTSAGCS
jgi:hypothetical protein